MHKRIFIVTLAFALAGCGSNSQVPISNASQRTPGSASERVPAPSPQPTATPKPSATPKPGTPIPTATPKPTPTPPTLAICGPLSFQGITWSTSLSSKARTALALGMSITGSFEGTQSWATIANNSDGQGLSLGLMQQNFGQGTLQPLLIEMIVKKPTQMASLFTSSDLNSLKRMLSTWDSDDALMIQSSDELFPDFVINSLEEDGGDIEIQSVADQASVTWAKANIYSGSTFVPRWKTSFQNLASTEFYRSLQVLASMQMFNKAKAYFTEFGFKEMRSLLLMYDFVVQNGGFTSTHRANYRAYIAQNPNATETQRALKLLEIRLVSVLSQYRADVRARKSTIINNTGTVHGATRNLAKEYCFTPAEKLSATF